MNDFPSAQPPDDADPATGQPPADPAGAQPPYAYPPPPPTNQVWPPPPGDGSPSPLPLFPTPANAVLILVVGIVSIAAALLCGMGGLIGILPWVMGNASLRAIDQGLANPMERGLVNGGRICGIVGTVLAALMLVFGGLFLAYGLYSEHHGG